MIFASSFVVSLAFVVLTTFSQDYEASDFFFDAGIGDPDQIAHRLLITKELLTWADDIDNFNQNHNQDWYETLRQSDISQMRETAWEDYFTLDDIENWKETKRIRREIRDIPYSDFIKIANAMNIMKFTDQITGIETYGNKFRNYDYLICLHGLAAWQKQGNENHHVPSFTTWHRAFELMFEDSIIAIDASIEAMPYWDYRRDYLEPFESIMWTDKYMGELMSDAHSLYGIKDGPFQLWPVINAIDAGPNCTEVENIWGQLRHPVSKEAGPYVTRMGSAMCGYKDDKLGSMDKWNECLDLPNHGSYANFTTCFDIDVHGLAHTFVGGSRPRDELHITNPIYKNGSWPHNDSTCLSWVATETILNEDNLKTSIYYSHPKYGCFDCDISKHSKSCGIVDHDNYGCTVNGYNGIEYYTEFNNETDEFIFGDFTDAVASPNEPFFMFHHINMDRYSYIWQLKNYNERPYYDYPTSGYIEGVNLDDVPGFEHPLINVFPNMFGNQHALSNKDIFDATTIENMPYIYADMLEAIEGRIKQTTGTETNSISNNNDDDDDDDEHMHDDYESITDSDDNYNNLDVNSKNNIGDKSNSNKELSNMKGDIGDGNNNVSRMDGKVRIAFFNIDEWLLYLMIMLMLGILLVFFWVIYYCYFKYCFNYNDNSNHNNNNNSIDFNNSGHSNNNNNNNNYDKSDDSDHNDNNYNNNNENGMNEDNTIRILKTQYSKSNDRYMMLENENEDDNEYEYECGDDCDCGYDITINSSNYGTV